MTYITVVPQACFNVGSVDEGTCIHSWWREVTPELVQFTAQCGPDDGSGRCALCWKQGADESGNLVLTYSCDDIDCLSMKKSKGKSDDEGCVLEYSLDGRVYNPVSEEEPEAGVNCYFRCRCAAGEKAKAKPKSKRKPKSKPKAKAKKTKAKSKSKSKSKKR